MLTLVATDREVVVIDVERGAGAPAHGISGSPTCLTADPLVQGRAWCGTHRDGVFRSDDGGRYPRSARSLPGIGPFPGNQFAMPSQNGVVRDKRRHVSQYGASEPLPEYRETPPLPIVQVQPASRQLGFQHAILLPKKHDHIALLSLEPSEQRGEEHLERKHAVSSTPMCRPSFQTLRERRAPPGPDVGQPDPEPTVRRRERQPPRPGSLQYL